MLGWSGATVAALVAVALTGQGGAMGLEGAAAAQIVGVLGIAVGLLADRPLRRLVRALGAHGPGPRLALIGAAVVFALALSARVEGLRPRAYAGVEAAGYARAYHAIQATSTPYGWTAVGHRGVGIRARHRGRYMDYGFFLQNYRPEAYDHTGPGAIPTPDLYVFVEKDPLGDVLVDELRPLDDAVLDGAQAWLDAYGARDDLGAPPTVFYDDDQIRVVRLSRPAPTILKTPDLLDRVALRR